MLEVILYFYTIIFIGETMARNRSAIIINGPSQRHNRMHTQSFQGETENNVLQLQPAAAAVLVLHTGAAIMTMNSTH